MIFKIYKFSDSNCFKFEQLTNLDLPKNLNTQIKIFEEEIIKEYFKKQEGRKGIKTLGNELRYNKVIQDQVFIETESNILVKITGNRKDFLKDFIFQIVENKDKKILFLLIYGENFLKKSSIVDFTSPNLNDLTRDLNLLFSAFPGYDIGFEFYILQIIDVEGFYFITDDEGFTKIYKK
jgi:hypothetical protein